MVSDGFYITILGVARCNRHCTNCAVESEDTADNPSWDEIKTGLSRFPPKGEVTLTFGEPMIYCDETTKPSLNVGVLARYLQELIPGLYVNIVTSGICFEDQIELEATRDIEKISEVARQRIMFTVTMSEYPTFRASGGVVRREKVYADTLKWIFGLGIPIIIREFDALGETVLKQEFPEVFLLFENSCKAIYYLEQGPYAEIQVNKRSIVKTGRAKNDDNATISEEDYWEMPQLDCVLSGKNALTLFRDGYAPGCGRFGTQQIRFASLTDTESELRERVEIFRRTARETGKSKLSCKDCFKTARKLGFTKS